MASPIGMVPRMVSPFHVPPMQKVTIIKTLSIAQIHHLQRLASTLHKASLRKTSDAFECLWRSRWSWGNLRSGAKLAIALEAQMAAASEADDLLRILLGSRKLQRVLDSRGFLMRAVLAKLLHHCRYDFAGTSELPRSHYLVSKPDVVTRGMDLPPSHYLSRQNANFHRMQPQSRYMVSASTSATSINDDEGGFVEERRSATSTSSPLLACFSPPPGKWEESLHLETCNAASVIGLGRLPVAPTQLPRRKSGDYARTQLQRTDAAELQQPVRSERSHSVGASSMPVPMTSPTEFRPSLSATGPVAMRASGNHPSSHSMPDHGARSNHAKGQHLSFFEELPSAPSKERERSVTIEPHDKREEWHPQCSAGSSSEGEGEWWDNARRSTSASRVSIDSQARLRAGTSLRDKLSHKEVSKRRTVAAQALGVSKDASRKTVTKAFHDRALLYHPDKGGDTDDFKLVNVAYKRLKDDTAG